ncbi:MAG: hypothetical protein SGJ11_06125 [Phycisphaerae bacterium]|nr:hypothetical protein [Phycisphaerae bacterium]
MSRQVKNVEQIRMLLKQMDRSVDDARHRREGTRVPSSTATPLMNGAGSPGGPGVAGQWNTAARQPGAQHPGMQAPRTSETVPNNGSAPAPQQASTPSAQPMKPVTSIGQQATTTVSPHGNGSAAPSPRPERLKAKPKRASGSDPLQDFQQRQAS